MLIRFVPVLPAVLAGLGLVTTLTVFPVVLAPPVSAVTADRDPSQMIVPPRCGSPVAYPPYEGPAGSPPEVTPFAPTYPAGTPNAGVALVAFASRVGARGPDFDIFVVGSDGLGRRNLTGHPAADFAPAWSPDGNRIAFTSDRDGHCEVYVMAADGSAVQRVTSTRQTPTGAVDAYGPRWSPDGSLLSFVVSTAGGETGRIAMIRPDGSALRLLTDAGAAASGPAWSPDGTRIAFSAQRANHTEIGLVDVRTGTVTELTNDPGISAVDPTWSSDGSRLAFVARPDAAGMPRVELVNADGSGRAALWWEPSAQLAPRSLSWSPDGATLAFIRLSGVSGPQSGEVFLVAARPTDPMTGPTCVARAMAPIRWSPDSSYIVFSSTDREWQGIRQYSPGWDVPWLTLARGPDLLESGGYQPDWQPGRPAGVQGHPFVGPSPAGTPGGDEISAESAEPSAPASATVAEPGGEPVGPIGAFVALYAASTGLYLLLVGHLWRRPGGSLPRRDRRD